MCTKSQGICKKALRTIKCIWQGTGHKIKTEIPILLLCMNKEYMETEEEEKKEHTVSFRIALRKRRYLV